jgi:hypothetical protein
MGKEVGRVGGGGDVRRLESVHMRGWCRASLNHAGPSHTKIRKIGEYMGGGKGKETVHVPR